MLDDLALLGFGPEGWGRALIGAALTTVAVSVCAFVTGLVLGTLLAWGALGGGPVARRAAYVTAWWSDQGTCPGLGHRAGRDDAGGHDRLRVTDLPFLFYAAGAAIFLLITTLSGFVFRAAEWRVRHWAPVSWTGASSSTF